MDVRSRGRRGRHRVRRARAVRRALSVVLTRARPVRMGPRAKSQWRQRRRRRARAPGNRRKVRCAWRRVLDEQFGSLRDQVGSVDERHARTGYPARQHEPPRTRADRIQRSAGRDAVRLQLQPAGDDAGSEPRARGTQARRPLHGGVSSRSSPTPPATPTCCCLQPRFSKTTTWPRAMARSACSSFDP